VSDGPGSHRGDTHVGLIPHSERRRINLDDGTLDETVGPDQLVV
jgi:hypothetical protein